MNDEDIADKVLKQLDELMQEDIENIKQGVDADADLPEYSNLILDISQSHDIAEGENFGHWKILKHIGKGGMSNVYLVERNDGQVQLKAALKVIPQGMASQALIERFQRERQILTDLNHPNIAKLYDAGITQQGVPWFVMEYIDGKDLISYAQDHQLNIEQRILLFKQVCEALAYSHAQGIIHRDIKPSNLLVDEGKSVKLLDFGIAANEENTSLTMTGMVVGTPGYLSPEQAKGLIHAIDRRSDIFSLGVLLYKILQNKMPFVAESISEISYKTIYSEPAQLDKKISKELQAITFKCLEKKVEDRYSSAKELIKDIDAYLNGDVVIARKVTVWLRLSKKIKKHPAMSKIITAAIVLVFMSIGYAIYQSIDSLKRVQMTKEYMVTVQDMQGRITRTHLLPLHNVQTEYQQIADEIEQLREKIEKNGVDNTGFSDFALGLAYQNMKDFKKSLEYFQLAKDKGWESSELYSGLGMGFAIDWSNRKVKSNSIQDINERQLFLEQAKIETYIPAILCLKQAQIGAIDANFLAARIAYIEQDYDAALKYAEAEIQLNPWNYEALRLSSEIYLYKFKTIGGKEGYDVALKYLDLSNEKLEQSINIGRSDPYNYISRCTNASIDVQIHKMFKFEDKLYQAFDKGVEVCQDALQLKPDAESPWSSLNILYTTKAAFLESKQISAIETYQEAMNVAQIGLQKNPDNANLLGFLVKPLIKLAENAIEKNEDPIPYFTQAMDAINQAIQLSSDNPYLWTQLASLQLKYADYYLEILKDDKQAEHYYLQSIKNYEQNYQLIESLEAIGNIAEVKYKIAKIKLNQGNKLEAIDLFHQVIVEKKKALPLREIYLQQLIDLVDVQLELIELLSADTSIQQQIIADSYEFSHQICMIEGISMQQIQTLNQYMSLLNTQYPTQSDNIKQCKLK